MVPATAADDEEDLVAPNEELCASWAVCSLSTHHKGDDDDDAVTTTTHHWSSVTVFCLINYTRTD